MPEAQYVVLGKMTPLKRLGIVRGEISPVHLATRPATAPLRYYRARYYHPGLQRFVSEDPIGFAGGDPNLQQAYFDAYRSQRAGERLSGRK
jgi:hypothetical protein